MIQPPSGCAFNSTIASHAPANAGTDITSENGVERTLSNAHGQVRTIPETPTQNATTTKSAAPLRPGSIHSNTNDAAVRADAARPAPPRVKPGERRPLPRRRQGNQSHQHRERHWWKQQHGRNGQRREHRRSENARAQH